MNERMKEGRKKGKKEGRKGAKVLSFMNGQDNKRHYG
jgi:hypothetical protein